MNETPAASKENYQIFVQKYHIYFENIPYTFFLVKERLLTVMLNLELSDYYDKYNKIIFHPIFHDNPSAMSCWTSPAWMNQQINSNFIKVH